MTLSASGHPAGTSTSFSANPVAPPGSSTLTIGNTASAVAGNYLITVSGAATGSPGHSIDLTLDVYDDLPGIVTLVAPANGALNVPLRPTFSWTAAPQAASYPLEVDDDPGFGSPVIVQSRHRRDHLSLPTPSLASNTTYYWRVTADNLCGTGVPSTVYSFTTEALPGDCGMGTIPLIAFTEDFESGAPGWTPQRHRRQLGPLDGALLQPGQLVPRQRPGDVERPAAGVATGGAARGAAR